MTYVKTCPECGGTLKTVPAGVSKKTGKPYNSFIACEDRGCNYTEQLQYEKRAQKIDPNALILEEIKMGFKTLNERLDNMGKFMAGK